MKKQSVLILSCSLAAGLASAPALAELTVTPYGSLRIQSEAISVDDPIAGEDSSYSGLRDAYSRLGVNSSYVLNDEVTFSSTIEFPINSARLKAEDPTFFQGFYKDNNRPRVATIAAAHDDFGSLTFGTQWLAYYNNVAYPVDYFSSFYSGFATHATFRRDALTYVSPSIGGVTATISGVDMVHRNGTKYLDTMQYALSFTEGGFTGAIAYQDSISGRADLIGLAAAYTTGPWRFAAKVEQLLSDDSVTLNDDPVVYNLYGSYTWNQYTLKAMYGHGDDDTGEPDSFFWGDTVHLGLDYQHTDALKFFAEYFFEERGYAIYTPNSDSFEQQVGFLTESDGHAVAVGLRFDF